MDADSGPFPGKGLVDHSGTGQGAGMASDTTLHA
jgi:hypothetical protein